jgi:creatinine amidohydrolase
MSLTRRRFVDLTYEDVEALERDRLVLILPLGATEAHGPHLPLSTDVWIAEAMAESGAARLVEQGWEPWILPPFAYTAASFADGFAGTVSISPAVVTTLLVEVSRSLTRLGARALVLANAHLDPAHLGSLQAAIAAARGEDLLPIVFPDITRRPWAFRLSEEFQSGACHAGRYEGSMVAAVAPDFVRWEIQRRLPANPSSLSVAIRAGKTSFEEAGGPEAYFGDPASSSAEEGRATIATLGEIVAAAVAEALGEAPAG